MKENVNRLLLQQRQLHEQNNNAAEFIEARSVEDAVAQLSLSKEAVDKHPGSSSLVVC